MGKHVQIVRKNLRESLGSLSQIAIHRSFSKEILMGMPEKSLLESGSIEYSKTR